MRNFKFTPIEVLTRANNLEVTIKFTHGDADGTTYSTHYVPVRGDMTELLERVLVQYGGMQHAQGEGDDLDIDGPLPHDAYAEYDYYWEGNKAAIDGITIVYINNVGDRFTVTW